MDNIIKAKYCDIAQEGLYNGFWDQEDSIYRHHIPHDQSEHFVYWWHAHVIDALLDGYLRTRDKKYLERIKKEFDGTFIKNGNTLLNNWYDDMEWMALALLRMWDETKDDSYKHHVFILWEDIKTAWNDHQGGGLAWKKDQLDYKNTPANAPAAIIAYRLYQRFSNADDLAWGDRIFEWNYENLVDKETGFVWDGKNRLGDGKIDYEWEFTYCQGVFLGAALERYRITKDNKYLEMSIKTAMEAKKRLCDRAGGVIPYEGKDDCGLFKGIMVRYIYDLIEECPARSEIKELRQMLLHNAQTLCEKGMDESGIIGGSWDKKPTGVIDLAQQLSGVMLLEMAARL